MQERIAALKPIAFGDAQMALSTDGKFANGQPTLLIVDCALSPKDIVWLREQLPTVGDVSVLHLQDDLSTDGYPAHWSAITLDRREVARDKFLRFLESVVEDDRPIASKVRGLAPLANQYSVWWTVGPGSDRHPGDEPFQTAKSCCVVREALESLRPSVVVLHTSSRNMVAAVAPLVRGHGGRFALSPRTPAAIGIVSPLGLWLFRQACRIAGYLLREFAGWLRQSLTRLLARPLGNSPCILLTTDYPRHFEPDGTNWYWRSLRNELSSKYGIACRYLLDPNWSVLRGMGQSKSALGKVIDAIPVEAARISPWRMARLCWRQWLRLWQFYRLESDQAYRQLWQFAGTSLACIYVPRFRKAIQDALGWERVVEARTEAVRWSGTKPLAALVHCEFYRNGTINIAACRQLQIPTIGAQHGVVYPMHLCYTLPAGCVQDSPTPTYFAAYGEFAKETVTEVGAYPAERVVVVGAPRFDWLVRNPRRKEDCRDRLRLPRGAFVVLVTTQPYQWMIQAAQDLIEIVGSDPTCRVCIKLWLQDKNRVAYQALAKRAGAATVAVFADDFHDLLGACDVLASSTSTTLLEATLLGKPTISLDYSSAGDPYPYVEEGVSVRARNRDELAQALVQVRNGSCQTAAWSRKREAFVRRHVGAAAEGLGAEAFARFLHKYFLDNNAAFGSGSEPRRLAS